MDEQRISREQVENMKIPGEIIADIQTGLSFAQIADLSTRWAWLVNRLLAADDALKRISEFKTNTEGVAAEMRVLARAAMLTRSEEVSDGKRA